MNRQPAAKLLGVARMAIGVGLWLAPRRAMDALGFDADNPEAMVLARLAGTRDLALGAVALATADDPALGPKTVKLNAAVDAADALTFAVPLARRDGIDRAAVGGLASAIGATAFGLWLARRLER